MKSYLSADRFPKLGILLTFLFCCLLIPDTTKAQDKPYRVACPIGTRPLPHGVTVDPLIDSLVAFMCVDNRGNVFLIGNILNQSGGTVGVQTGTGAPTGTCVATDIYVDTTSAQLYTCNGGVWTLATAASFTFTQTGLEPILTATVGTNPILNFSAQNQSEGTFLAGPIPTGSATKPSFEVAYTNSSTTGTPTVSGISLTATSVAVYTQTNSLGAHTAPDGAGWTLINNALGNGSTYYKNLSVITNLTATTTQTSATWTAQLQFFGGSITSFTASGASSNCGTGCIQATLVITAGHAVLVRGEWSSASKDFTDAQATDNCGNNYSFVSHAFPDGGSGIGLDMFVANNAVGGTCVIQVKTSASHATNWSSMIAWDLTGPTSFYAGEKGPYTFRRISPQDIFTATGGLGFSQIQGVSKISGTCTASGANSYNSCTDTLTWPVPFADNNYIVVALCVDPNVNNALQPSSEAATLTVASHSTTQVVLTTQTQRTINATCTELHAIGLHP